MRALSLITFVLGSSLVFAQNDQAPKSIVIQAHFYSISAESWKSLGSDPMWKKIEASEKDWVATSSNVDQSWLSIFRKAVRYESAPKLRTLIGQTAYVSQAGRFGVPDKAIRIETDPKTNKMTVTWRDVEMDKRPNFLQGDWNEGVVSAIGAKGLSVLLFKSAEGGRTVVFLESGVH